MRSRLLRISLIAASISVGGVLAVGTGCVTFLGETLLSVADVCFILDCTDAVSGAVEFCDPAVLQDCP